MITTRAITSSAMMAGSIGGSLPRGSRLILHGEVRLGHPLSTGFTRERGRGSLQRVTHDGGRAVDLEDPDGLADGEALAAVLGPGTPLVGTHPDAPTGVVH